MQNDVRRTYRTYDDTFFYTIIVHTSLGLTFSLKAFLWQYDLCSVRTSKNGEKSSHPDVLWVLSLFPRSFQIPVQFYLTFRKKIAKFWFRQSLQKTCKKSCLHTILQLAYLQFLSDLRYILQKYNNERIHFFLYHTNCKMHRHHCKCSNWVAKYCSCQQILHGKNS